MQRHHLAAVAAAAIALSIGAHADVSKKDQEFFTKAAAGGMYEVEAGKLAQAKGQSEGVKSYGGRLVKDHGTANEELKGPIKLGRLSSSRSWINSSVSAVRTRRELGTAIGAAKEET